MATQDDWKRITLRIPQELYDRVEKSAGAASVNSEILSLLKTGLGVRNSIPKIEPVALKAVTENLAKVVETYRGQMTQMSNQMKELSEQLAEKSPKKDEN